MAWRLSRRQGLAMGVWTAAAVPFSASAQPAHADPLPSWNDGPAKRSIMTFVGRVTREGPDFVPSARRIAVFDNDGTLWVEQPIYAQLAFALDRVRALAPQHPEWRAAQPFKAILEGDTSGFLATGEKGALELIMATHAGMTTTQFAATVADWLASARDGRFHRPYTELTYQPMLELLRFLRASGFKTFIVTGGGVEFVRVFSERVYAIPPEQVIGSSIVTRFVMEPDGKPVLEREARINFIDDGPGKPVGINQFIGRRPILAFGNSDGDREMLEWTSAGDAPSLVGLVHHTDAAREWAYDRRSGVGRLDKALNEANRKGWLVVDMKRDWWEIFAFKG